MRHCVGIDIGSTCTKLAVLDEDKEIKEVFLRPTGWSSKETAELIKDQLKDKGITAENSKIVSTGYGRASVAYADKAVTEITCHAKGASYLHGAKNLTVIDIGGQDTKIIQIKDGVVQDFMMNDKCSAGTGRFLEVMANSLALDISELCELAKQGSNVSISSMCTVFAESEVISLMGKGESKENIAHGIIDSIINRVAGQAQRFNLDESEVALTGGLYQFDYIREKLSSVLKKDVSVSKYGHYAGAIGAALVAHDIL